MRIFIFILSLFFSATFIFLNILGFNGALTLNEFFMINLIAEVLICLVLGYFMYRTYANRKKLKKLQQEMTTRQAGATAQEQASKKRGSKRKQKRNEEAAAPAPKQAPQQPTAPQAPKQQPQQPAAPQVPKQQPQQPAAPQAPQAPQQAANTNTTQQPMGPDVTQPMKAVHTDTPDIDGTALYKTPFGK